MRKIELESDSILIVLAKRIKYDSLTIPYDSIRPNQLTIEFPEYRKPENLGWILYLNNIQNILLPN